MENIALITGASSGIGKDLAYIHAEQTGDLILIARSKDKLEEIKKDIEATFKRNVLLIIEDLSDPKAADNIYAQIKDYEIEYLINNAGFGGVGLFNEREEDMNMISVNIFALTKLTRLILPHMVKRKEGKILNVSSTASLIPGPLQAVYFATKAYVTSFSNALSRELKDTGITVTNLMPGATDTSFGKVSGMDKTDMFKSSKLARSKDVALEGYTGMIKGKINVIAGVPLAFKFLLPLLPFIPLQAKLNIIYEMQKID